MTMLHRSPRLAPRGTAAALAVALLAGALAPGLTHAQTGGPRTESTATSQVTLNFVNAEIEAVARAMGVILRRQFVVDPRVKGTMTLYSEQPMSRGDAYLRFLSELRGLGFAVVQVDDLYKIVPEADAKLQTGSVAVGGVTPQRGDQIVTQVFRIQHENANNLVTVLRPLISPNNTINVNPGNNTLVITDYAENVRRLGKIIAALDLPNATDLEVIPLQHAVASDLAVLVQRLVDQQAAAAGGAVPAPGQAAPAAAPGTGASGVSIIPDVRTNSLLVRAPNPMRLAMVKSVVARLDVPGQGGAAGSNIHVVYLKNADAVRLAQVLRAAFSAESRGGAAGGAGAAGLTGLGAAAGTTAATGAAGGFNAGAATGMAAAGAMGSPQATAPVGQVAPPSTGGFIQADPATNSLIITASEPLYRQLRAVIDQLDSRRAQVYVETMIVEVNATKAADIGFQWQGLLGKEGDKYGLIGGTNFGTGGNNIINLSIAAAGGNTTTLPSPGFNIGLIRNFGGVYSLAALARFLETNADGNILSTPNLVTLDNEEAKITIGQNVPFVTGQYANTGTGGTINPFQTIERKDVGITLRVRPQIGENGTVRLQIYQEVSSVVNQNVSQGVADATAGLVTNKRSIESSVVVDDGQIIVLGGLMQDQFQNNRDKVPVLGDAPVIGGLFRSENRNRTKTNLMVFLRPVVMRDQDAAMRFSLDRYDMIRAQQKEAQPEPRRLLPINEAPLLPPMRVPPAPDAATPPQPAASAPAPAAVPSN